MPPKTFTCAICGEQVSKRQSYLYDKVTGARACRTHEETQDKQEIFKAQEEARKAKEERTQQIRQREKRAHQFGTPEFYERSDEIRNGCWKCLGKGLHHREWYMRQLIAMKKVELKEGRKPLPLAITKEGIQDIRKVNEAMKSPMRNGDRTLYLGQWPVPEDRLETTLNGIRKRFRETVEFFKYVQLCPQCAKKLGYSVSDLHPDLRDIPLETLSKFGAVFEATLGKAFQCVAEREVDIEKQNEDWKN